MPHSEALDTFASALEWVLPEYPEEVYDFWKGASVDGIYPRVTRKIGARSVEQQIDEIEWAFAIGYGTRPLDCV